jgi:hypothetical protein
MRKVVCKTLVVLAHMPTLGVRDNVMNAAALWCHAKWQHVWYEAFAFTPHELMRKPIYLLTHRLYIMLKLLFLCKQGTKSVALAATGISTQQTEVNYSYAYCHEYDSRAGVHIPLEDWIG